MKAEVNKLHHLSIDYVARRNTLAEANKRRPQEFFANVYAYLLERYSSLLADSRPKGEQKDVGEDSVHDGFNCDYPF